MRGSLRRKKRKNIPQIRGDTSHANGDDEGQQWAYRDPLKDFGRCAPSPLRAPRVYGPPGLLRHRVQMVTCGLAVLIVGSVVHTWSGAKARQRLLEGKEPLPQGMAIPVLAHVLLLILGLGMLWSGGSFFLAVLGMGAYFFVLPLLVVPLLRALGLISVTEVEADPVLRLLAALERGKVVEVETYLDQGWDVSMTFPFLYDSEPLHIAAHHGRRQLAELLLCRGANPNARDAAGKTPLHYAALYGHADLVDLLLDGGALANMKDDDAETALALAAASGHPRIVQALEAHGTQA